VTGLKEEVEERGEWESHMLWFKVTKGIREGDFNTAAWEMSCIEVGCPLHQALHHFILISLVMGLL
jgi:hypothetical protein